MRVNKFHGVFQRNDVDGLGSLISLRIAASVVDLPEPVAPVTSTRPVFSLADLLENRRQFQLRQGGNVGVQFPQDDGERPRWRKC